MVFKDNVFLVENSASDINGKKGGLFSRLENFLLLRGFLSDLPIKYIKKALILFLIGLFYIANSHFYDRTVRRVFKLQEEVERLRVDYTMLKAEYMFDSKRSEVARRLQPYGIDISNCPPFVVNKK